MKVMKTLVIGLGSTGTKICDQIIDRIDWEVGGLACAPWIKFLAIETDANQGSRLQKQGDFRTLGMSDSDFRNALASLPEWADEQTLRKLPDGNVTSGAGNIRMVGLLAFLNQKNQDDLTREVQDRLNHLRALNTNAATEALQAKSGNQDLEITEFADGGRLRVIVVGTLCGGTGSGLASDFGFFLRKMLQAYDGDKTIAMFTLPRPDLDEAIEPKASRFKKNAYTALTELNHYYLTGSSDTPVDPSSGSGLGQFPYDLPFLLMPREVGSKGERELNRAIADRIFLNIFTPDIDPNAKTVDASIFDRGNRAHVFCTFGLSTLEFPAQRVAEACTKRLLAHSLSQWQGRAPDGHTSADLIGLNWDAVYQFMQTLPDGTTLEQKYGMQVENIVSVSSKKSSFKDAESGNRTITDRLTVELTQKRITSDEVPDDLIERTLAENQARLVRHIHEKIRSRTGQYLRTYSTGLAPLRHLLQSAQEQITQLSRMSPQSDDDALRSISEDIDGIIYELREEYNSWRLFKRKTAQRSNELTDRLNKAMREAIGLTLKARIIEVLQKPLADSSTTLENLSTSLRPIQRRLDNLNARLTSTINQLNREADELARREPESNGIVLFEPETTYGGTVREEYERCLQDPANSEKRWTVYREEIAQKIIDSWLDLKDSNDLIAAIAPAQAPSPSEDFLLIAYNPNQTPESLRPQWRKVLEEGARKPFASLFEINALDRWEALQNNAAGKAEAAAKRTAPFLKVDIDTHLKNLTRINKRKVVLLPKSQHEQAFKRAISSDFSELDTIMDVRSPNPYRVMMLEERYRFPLNAVSTVLGPNSLQYAQNNDFPTYHTRDNVFWASMTEEDNQVVTEAEELAVLALLYDIMRPSDGRVMMDWHSGGFGDPPERWFPQSITGIARMLTQEGRDLRKLPLNGVRKRLKDQIQVIIQSQSNDPQHPYIEFIRDLDKRLQSHPYGFLNGGRGWPLVDGESNPMRWAGRTLRRYFARDEVMFRDYLMVKPPAAAAKSTLWRTKGEQVGSANYTAPEDGYYCTTDSCGGLIGRTELEAARNSWCCAVNRKHYYGDQI